MSQFIFPYPVFRSDFPEDAFHGILPEWNITGWMKLTMDDIMMISSNGNIFHVTGLLCGEFTGHRWIPLTKASDTIE